MNRNELDSALELMWQDYLQLNPDARRIWLLFSERNSRLVNDHIALRTFDLPEVNIDCLARPFVDGGYLAAGEYHFPVKKLYARHYQHPDESLPKIFISQLLTAEFSPWLQQQVRELVDCTPESVLKADDLSYSGRHWPISFSTYQQFEQESDYAAWVYAMGFRPNHFTLLINALKSHPDIRQLNSFLQQQGFDLNMAGGAIKGSREELLEQSSTLANLVRVQFSDGEMEVPGCYYEFAQRYPQADGELFHGFVAGSADKIFQSTDRHPSGGSKELSDE